MTNILGSVSFKVIHYTVLVKAIVEIQIYSVSGKSDQNVFCNIFYKSRAILIKFGRFGFGFFIDLN